MRVTGRQIEIRLLTSFLFVFVLSLLVRESYERLKLQCCSKNRSFLARESMEILTDCGKTHHENGSGLSLSLSFCLCLSLCLSVSVSLSLSQSLSFTHSLTPSLSLSLTQSPHNRSVPVYCPVCALLPIPTLGNGARNNTVRPCLLYVPAGSPDLPCVS